MNNKNNSFVLHGDICYSESPDELLCVQNGYLVCENGVSQGAFDSLPERYENLTLIDHEGKMVLPGLTDLHMHAPQFAFRGLGMDYELLEWLDSYAFPEEAKYGDIKYAGTAYADVVRDMINGANTRFCVFATIHLPATRMLMDILEESGLASMVGKVNMDRNCPAYLREKNANSSAEDTRSWLSGSVGRYKNTYPILTPRFIPTCSDELMHKLAELRREFNVPVQSHLSESLSEIEWVRQLCPLSKSYADAYERLGLFGGEAPTIMAHCVWPDDEEIELIQRKKVYIAHCPQSNTNLSSGIAPVRKFLDRGVPVGLGSDVAGGCHTSIFRAMSDAIQVSKLRCCLLDSDDQPLTVKEAFYLGTLGGGSFFGKVGSFEAGYEFDAIIVDDDGCKAPYPLSIEERLARVIYLSDDKSVLEKYVRGQRVK